MNLLVLFVIIKIINIFAISLINISIHFIGMDATINDLFTIRDSKTENNPFTFHSIKRKISFPIPL